MTGARETIAVYSEETIRTYGFNVQRNLVLVTLTPTTAALDLDTALREVGIRAGRLRMATAQGQPDGSLQIQVILEPEGPVEPSPTPAPIHAVQVRQPVEVICLQGPHYGDRYGIAARALEELDRAEIEVLTLGCTGASIYLAVDGGRADAAVEALGRAFVVPPSEPRGAPGTAP